MARPAELDFESLSMRISELERKNAELFAITAAVGGMTVIALSIAGLRRYRVATFSHVTAERLSLVTRSGSISMPDCIALDAFLNTSGQPVVNLYGGRIVLYAQDRASPLLQLDCAWSPMSQHRSGSGALGPGEAWALDRHGNAQEIAPLRDRPVVCVYGPDARPGVAVTEVGVIDLTPRVAERACAEPPDPVVVMR